MNEQVVMGKIHLEVNNTGAALRIAKGELQDEINNTINFVRAHVQPEEVKDRLVSDLKHHLKLARNI